MFALLPWRPRGWLLLSFGAATLALAAFLGRRDLLMVALFCFLLPLAAGLALHAFRPKFTLKRRISPAPAQVGVAITVTLEVRGSNTGAAGIRLTENLPPSFLVCPSFAFPHPVVPQGRLSRYHYELHPHHRGVFLLGPLRGNFSDPFDVASVHRDLDAGELLTIAPAAVTLPAIALGDAGGHDGAQVSRAPAHANHDDAMAREYRPGDPLRRVHWPVTARAGKLMVRAEESVATPAAALILDQRPGAFGSHTRSPAANAAGSLRTTPVFETAVVAAMSVATHLLERGYSLRFLDQLGEPAFNSSASAADPDQENFSGPTAALEVALGLAALELPAPPNASLPHREPFAEPLALKVQQGRRRGPLVAITGSLNATEALLLASTADLSTHAYALLLCPEGGQVAEALVILRNAGWHAAALTQRSRLEEVWAQLDSTPTLAGGQR